MAVVDVRRLQSDRNGWRGLEAAAAKAAPRLRHPCVGCHPLCAAGAGCVWARHTRAWLQNQATVERRGLQAEAREVTVAREIGRAGATVVGARRIMPR